jgi:hypothetical protein
VLNSEIIPILEPLLGTGLALNLAYLNLPMFSFLTQISASVGDKLSSLSDVTKKQISATPWYLDAVEISKVRNFEKLKFGDGGKRWTPFKSLLCAVLFNLLFKYRLGKLLSLVATVIASLMIISGVEVQIWPDDKGAVWRASLYLNPYLLALFCFAWPIFCISSGGLIKFLSIRDLNYNLKNLGVEAMANVSEMVGGAEKAVGDQ